MYRLWKYNTGEISGITIAEDHILVSSGNRLLCFDLDGLSWRHDMHTTFYRDPYGDVAITALDAGQSLAAVGTNFMDGKLYLYTIDGELLWEHQFATTASLGWRPEDVTAVKLGNDVVAAGTEFMNEYVYVYTHKRKRVFQKRVAGRVEDFLFLKDRIIAGTDRYLYVFSRKGEPKWTFSIPVKKLVAFGNGVIVLNRNEAILFELNNNVTEIWRIHASNPDVSAGREFVLLSSGNLLRCITKDGEVLWEKTLDAPAVSLHCEDRMYVGAKNTILVLSENGETEERLKVDGVPLKFGDGLVAVSNKSLSLYSLH
ncbi:PQQ-binding-like beta-propeller repeat protein [Archaeoglobus neptunius]|uniref:hypothetical protein n=1 Tax=Archaeoglobus neptunius TaxID=2798580 RepID=UPI0019288EAD|nr:hypothetical protein [Archaeoglobus neptunius]